MTPQPVASDPAGTPVVPTPPPTPVEGPDLGELARLLAECTPGRWGVWAMTVLADQDGTNNADAAVEVAQTYQRDEFGKPRTFDADLICALRNAASFLLAQAAAVERMRELHECSVSADWCMECEDSWPCATLRALDGRSE